MKKDYFVDDTMIDNYLTYLYYKFTGGEDSFPDGVNPLPEKRIHELYTQFYRKFESIYGAEFIHLLKGKYLLSRPYRRCRPDSDEIEKIENSLDNPEESLTLYEFACADTAKPDLSIIKKICSSYEYGIQFFYIFNLKHDIVSEHTLKTIIAQDTIYILAASTSSFYKKTGYIWSDRFFSGYESSLYRVGKDDYRFIIHAKKDSLKMKRIKITIKNPGEKEMVLFKDCLEKNENIIFMFKGEINEKTYIIITISGIE